MAENTETSRSAGYELTITRTFDAPVSLVFQIWRERDHMQRLRGGLDPMRSICRPRAKLGLRTPCEDRHWP